MSLASAIFPAVCAQGDRPAVGFRPLAGRDAIPRGGRMSRKVVRDPTVMSGNPVVRGTRAEAGRLAAVA